MRVLAENQGFYAWVSSLFLVFVFRLGIVS